MNRETAVILGILAEDKEIIPYRKSLNKLTGSVTATILLQQMIYWAKSKGWQPFYKFKEPCNHDLYTEGDSWTEELGFSRAEFDTALSKIGTKVIKGDSKADAYKKSDPTGLIVYWTDRNRVTWYSLNVALLGKVTMSLYLVKQETDFTGKSEKSALPYTETTTEITTDIHDGHSQKIKIEDDFPPIDPNFSKASKLYSDKIQLINRRISDELHEIFEDCPDSKTAYEWVSYAIEQAEDRNKKNWRYIKAIVDNIKKDGGLENHQASFGNEPEPEKRKETKEEAWARVARQNEELEQRNALFRQHEREYKEEVQKLLNLGVDPNDFYKFMQTDRQKYVIDEMPFEQRLEAYRHYKNNPIAEIEIEDEIPF